MSTAPGSGWANAGLALAGCAVALLVAEGAIRWFDIGPRFQVVFRDLVESSDDPVLGYELRPGAAYENGFISSGGLRDRERALEKPTDGLRIVAIGDSVTFGSGVEREHGWVASLERLLRGPAEAGSRGDVEVINLGVPGYNVTQVAERLAVRGLAYAPDVVLYGYVLNDPQSYSMEGAALGWLSEDAEQAFRWDGARGVKRWLASSRLFLLVRHAVVARVRPRIPDVELDDPAYRAINRGSVPSYVAALHQVEASQQRLAAGLAAVVAHAESAGARPALAIFPVFPEDDPDGSPPDVHDDVSNIARSLGMGVFDLREPFIAARRAFDEPLSIDPLHPSALGHRIAAHALRLALCDELAPAPAGCRAPPTSPVDDRVARALSTEAGGDE